jgi:hypothetical protein
VPVVSEKVGEVLSAVAPHDLQLITARIGATEGFCVINLLNSGIECVDLEESHRRSWRSGRLPKPVIVEKQAGHSAIFRARDLTLVVTEELMTALLDARVSGPAFEELATV